MKNSKIEIYELEPKDFNADVEVSACYLEIEGKILLLAQGPKKQETGAWGVPAGKIEKNETPHEAARRELLEETGIETDHVYPLGCLYIRKPELEYVYHLFKVILTKTPPIRISEEHQAYQWVPFENLQELTLMTGAEEALQHYKLRTSDREIK